MGDVLVGLAIRVVTPRQKLIEILELYNTFIICIWHYMYPLFTIRDWLQPFKWYIPTFVEILNLLICILTFELIFKLKAIFPLKMFINLSHYLGTFVSNNTKIPKEIYIYIKSWLKHWSIKIKYLRNIFDL